MPIVSSNMISKHYCPKCNSFDLFKVHRTYIQKNILGSPNKFQCKACETIFKHTVFETNEPKEVPVFIEEVPAKAPDIMTDAPQQVPIRTKSNRPTDETIVAKKKARVWPYLVGSLLILLGAAYVFIGMPFSSNLEITNHAKMDMSIETTHDALPEVVEVLPTEVQKEIEVIETIAEPENIAALEKIEVPKLETEAVVIADEIQTDETNDLVEVPLLETMVKMYVVTGQPVNTASASEATETSKVVALTKVEKNKSQQQAAEASSDELLEKVAIKFLQQDLDKLLSK